MSRELRGDNVGATIKVYFYHQCNVLITFYIEPYAEVHLPGKGTTLLSGVYASSELLLAVTECLTMVSGFLLCLPYVLSLFPWRLFDFLKKMK